jgi:hypothetical protein
MLVSNVRGGYSFLKGISPYSAGVVAARGFEIEYARFLRPVPLTAGFEAVDAHLRALGRPRHALCAMALRSPQPFTFEGFAEFNRGYVDVLRGWDVFQDGMNPVARTNVAPAIGAPAEPSLVAFAYTLPASTAGASSSNPARPTFGVAGAGELPEGALDAPSIVRRGDLSPAGLRAKVRFVMDLMEGRLSGLGVGWADVTTTDVYTVHDVADCLADELLARMGPAAAHGLTCFYTRPPVVEIEYEMDLRGCRREVVLDA